MAAVENMIVCLYTSCLMSLDEVSCDSDVKIFQTGSMNGNGRTI